MSTSRSVRFDSTVLARLRRYAGAHGGVSVSGAANRLVDEALRMEEFPGVIFRPGPSGRRAGLAGGPDIWEVVKAVQDARAADSTIDGEEAIAITTETTGLATAQVRLAIHYYGSYPAEVDERIEAAEEASRAAEDAWQVEQRLLA